MFKAVKQHKWDHHKTFPICSPLVPLSLNLPPVEMVEKSIMKDGVREKGTLYRSGAKESGDMKVKNRE